MSHENPEDWLPCLPYRLKHSNRAKDGWVLDKTFQTGNCTIHWWWSLLHWFESWNYSDHCTFHQSAHLCKVIRPKAYVEEGGARAQHRTLCYTRLTCVSLCVCNYRGWVSFHGTQGKVSTQQRFHWTDSPQACGSDPGSLPPAHITGCSGRQHHKPFGFKITHRLLSFYQFKDNSSSLLCTFYS